MASYSWIQEQYGLEPEEAAVVEWQYGYCGDFHKALWEAIARADENNLDRLGFGFPVEVTGFKKYSQEPGWWQNVLEKINKQHSRKEDNNE